MNNKKSKSVPIKSVLAITVGLFILYLIKEWNWAMYISLSVGILGLFFPFIATQIDLLWMKLAKLLGFIVPNILLSIIFYFFLTPLAFLSKIFGKKNPLSLNNKTDTLFKEYNKKFDKASFEKPW